MRCKPSAATAKKSSRASSPPIPKVIIKSRHCKRPCVIARSEVTKQSRFVNVVRLQCRGDPVWSPGDLQSVHPEVLEWRPKKIPTPHRGRGWGEGDSSGSGEAA